MARYIIRPKQLQASAAVSLAAVRMDAKSRAKQIKAVLDYRLSNIVDQELRRWIGQEKSTGVQHVSRGEQHTSVTGTTILDMDESKAERLKNEVEGLMIVPDQPIELIRPARTAAISGSPSSDDLWHLSSVGLSAARELGFSGAGAGVTVAVLDTGIDSTHTELSGRVVGAVTFDVDNWAVNPQNPSIDTAQHGTHVAGLICGKKVGIAPKAQVWNGVMIPKGFGNLSDFVLAMEWAASQGEISVVNMSAGIRGFVEGMEDVIEDLLAVGVLPIIATGNEGRGRTRSPGNYNPVLSVGASDINGGIASFSSSGTHIVNNNMYNVPDLVAPGKDITSCVPGGGFETWDGTSMATPVVSGIAALIIEQNPDILALELMDTLLDTCKDLGKPSSRQGEGLVQVTAAVGNVVAGVVSSKKKTKKKKTKKKTSKKKTKRKTTKKSGKKKAKKKTSKKRVV